MIAITTSNSTSVNPADRRLASDMAIPSTASSCAMIRYRRLITQIGPPQLCRLRKHLGPQLGIAGLAVSALKLVGQRRIGALAQIFFNIRGQPRNGDDIFASRSTAADSAGGGQIAREIQRSVVGHI